MKTKNGGMFLNFLVSLYFQRYWEIFMIFFT